MVSYKTLLSISEEEVPCLLQKQNLPAIPSLPVSSMIQAPPFIFFFSEPLPFPFYCCLLPRFNSLPSQSQKQNCCPLLPHSSSAYPIKSPESHPFTLCHLSSIIITLRFSCRVGLWEAATDRKQKPTETPEKNHSFSWKSRFQRAAFPARGRVLLIQRTGEEKHCTSFHASTQKTQWEPRPGNCVACPPQQVLDLKGRPKARPQGRESAQGKPDESARSH